MSSGARDLHHVVMMVLLAHSCDVCGVKIGQHDLLFYRRNSVCHGVPKCPLFMWRLQLSISVPSNHLVQGRLQIKASRKKECKMEWLVVEIDGYLKCFIS